VVTSQSFTKSLRSTVQKVSAGPLSRIRIGSVVSSPQSVEPEAGHEVEGHAGLQHRLVRGAQRHGALAPVGRVGDADRIAAAVPAFDADAGQRLAERVGDVAGAVARAGGVEPGLEPFGQRVGGAEHVLGRLAEEDRPAERRVVAAVAAGELEERGLARLHRLGRSR
jgi:hypothetical protein